MLPLSPARWLRTRWLGSEWLRGLWGRTIDAPTPTRRSRPSCRPLDIERLEDRTMLSVTHNVSVTGTNVEFSVPPNQGDTNDIYLRSSGDQVQWSEDNSTWQTVQDD